MEDVKRILVVSRDTQYDSKAVRYGFSLAKQYGAKQRRDYPENAVFSSFGEKSRNLKKRGETRQTAKEKL